MAKQTTKKPAVPTQTPAAPVEPKIMERSNVEVWHHLFAAETYADPDTEEGRQINELVAATPGQGTATKVDKWGPEKIKKIQHKHYFHSVNSDGTAQKQTAPVCGHIHEVKWWVDAEGNLKAECGPPLRRTVRPGPGGVPKVTWEPVKMRHPEDNRLMIDNHQHPMIYRGSQKITQQIIQQIQRNNSQAIMGSIQQGSVKPNAEANMPEGYSMSDSDRQAGEE